MGLKREELKRNLMAKAEVAIDKMLDDEQMNEEMTLSAIEAVIGKGALDFQQAALEEIITMQKATAKTCPVCGELLRNKGKQRRQVVSKRGEAVLERPYYECPACGRGYFPPR